MNRRGEGELVGKGATGSSLDVPSIVAVICVGA